MLYTPVASPLVSAIVVTKNRKQQLIECLRAFYATAGEAAEAVVVDNASTDDTAEVVEREFPQAKLARRPEDQGFARAGNAGLSLAAGRFLLLLSPEVEVLPGCVAGMVDLLLTHLEVGAVSPRLETPDGRLEPAARAHFPTPARVIGQSLGLGRQQRRPRSDGSSPEPEDGEGARQIDAGSFACLMLRQAAVDKVGFLDPDYTMYGEDLDLCCRLTRNGWKVYYLPRARAVRHRGRLESTDARARLWDYHRSIWTFHYKHYAFQLPAFANGLVWVTNWGRCLYEMARVQLRKDHDHRLAR
jgi:N-acetylglucosaminyl-diphospho-decaprenol L-rhamnosyltransferase